MMGKKNRNIFSELVVLTFYFVHQFYLVFEVFQDIWHFVSKYGE